MVWPAANRANWLKDSHGDIIRNRQKMRNTPQGVDHPSPKTEVSGRVLQLRRERVPISDPGAPTPLRLAIFQGRAQDASSDQIPASPAAHCSSPKGTRPTPRLHHCPPKASPNVLRMHSKRMTLKRLRGHKPTSGAGVQAQNGGEPPNPIKVFGIGTELLNNINDAIFGKKVHQNINWKLRSWLKEIVPW